MPQSGTSQAFDRDVPGENLQPGAPTFCAWLSSADRVRAQLTTLAGGREKTSMSFSRHEEIYRSDVGLGQAGSGDCWSSLPRLIGCNEFPVGYSSAGCPPAEPACASPTGNDSQQPTVPYNDFSANGTTPLTSCLTPRVHPRSLSSPASTRPVR